MNFLTTNIMFLYNLVLFVHATPLNIQNGRPNSLNGVFCIHLYTKEQSKYNLGAVFTKEIKLKLSEKSAQVYSYLY